MSNRLNQEREAKLQPKRIDVAKAAIEKLGYDIINEDSTSIEFFFNGELVKFFPYSGWHTGKSIKDGRGLNKLLRQLTAK